MGGGDFGIGRIFTPEKDWLGIDWSMGNKQEKAARSATKAQEALPPGPTPEEQAAALDAEAAKKAEATVTQKKRAIARSRTVYTSPLGISAQATTAAKTLLGQ